ncbi:MAG: signal transduction histidine kinase regulating citrate/malate metabolism [Pelosinus sp.]|nr:signal transduction histidine kinase regulating citrate/malate metabolism [Pelosinus sp.]
MGKRAILSQIPTELSEKIYQRGFTTKKGNSGLVLALILDKLKPVAGDNLPKGGVEFIVWLPY